MLKMDSSRHSRRRFPAVTCLVFVALMGTACGDDDEAAQSPTTGTSAAVDRTEPATPFEVAMIVDASGSFAVLSASASEGAQTAFEQINEDGGVEGRPIEFTIFDSQSTTAGTQTAAQQAVASEPDVIVTALLTSELAAITPTLEAAGVPVVATQPLTDLVASETTAPWFFALGSYAPQIAVSYVGLVERLVDGSLDGTRIASSALDSTGAVAAIEFAVALAEDSGAEIVSEERTPTSGFTSFASQATNIVAADPDVVILVDSSANVAIIVPALRVAGFEGPIIAGEGSSDDLLLENLADPDFFALRPYNTPQAGDVMTEAADEFGHTTTGTQFGIGWAQGYAVANGLLGCDARCTVEAFAGAMEETSTLEVPGDPAFTPLSFGPTKHYALTSHQPFSFDPEEGRAVATGEPISVIDVSAVPNA